MQPDRSRSITHLPFLQVNYQYPINLTRYFLSVNQVTLLRHPITQYRPIPDRPSNFCFPSPFPCATDELIRQVTINCAERGLLLLRVRDEIRMTIAAYQTLYESSIAFGIRKALVAEQKKKRLDARVRRERERGGRGGGMHCSMPDWLLHGGRSVTADPVGCIRCRGGHLYPHVGDVSVSRAQIRQLEGEREELEEQVSELMNRCTVTEKRDGERREAEERKHLDEVTQAEQSGCGGGAAGVA